MQPARIVLNVYNTGGADFVVEYDGREEYAVFPFPAATLQKLRYDGGADVQSASLDDPLATSQDVPVGKNVRVSFSDAGGGLASADGMLVANSNGVTTLATASGELRLTTASIRSVLLTDATHGIMPRLRLVYADSGTRSLVVRGTDPTFRSQISHTVVLEPSATRPGQAPGRWRQAAAVFHTYPWAISANELSLTEYESAPVQYAAVAAARKYADESAPGTQAPSANTGTVTLRAATTLERITAVSIRSTPLPNAGCHFLGTLDPTQEMDRQPLSLVLRLKPGDEFIPSGTATVLVDMDPLPGADHSQPQDINAVFFHNAWDADNRARMYKRLDTVTQVTARLVDDRRVSRDVQTGRITDVRHLKLTNALPYPVIVKLWLKSGMSTLNRISVGKRTAIAGEPLLTDTHVVDGREPATGNTWTLQLAVEANAHAAACELRVEHTPN